MSKKYEDGEVLFCIEIDSMDIDVPVCYYDRTGRDEPWCISATQCYLMGDEDADPTDPENYGHVIYVDNIWLGLSEGCKDFMVAHEVGHIINRDSMRNDTAAVEEYLNARREGRLVSMEKLADEYAIANCSDEQISEAIGVFSCIISAAYKSCDSIIISAVKELELRVDILKKSLGKRKLESSVKTGYTSIDKYFERRKKDKESAA